MYQVRVHMIRRQLQFSPKVRIANFHWEHWELAWKFILHVYIHSTLVCIPRNVSFWLTYTSYESSALDKGYRGKMWCYWEHLKEHIGNLKNDFKMHFWTWMIMHWEVGENPLGTSKSKPPSPPPKEKQIEPLDVAYHLVSLGCQEFVFITMFVTHFCLHETFLHKWRYLFTLDATLLQTFMGLGFKVLELQKIRRR